MQQYDLHNTKEVPPLYLLTETERAKFAQQISQALTRVNVIPMTIGTNMKLKVVICSRQQS